MALYDGFFDAAYNEETEKYDRAYNPGDFTGYFENIIGSGVCIHGNPDSFKAEYEDGTLYLRPGHLFIRGYWLANKAGEGETAYKGYAVTLPAEMTGSMAVVAHLNLGQRLIEIQVQSVSQSYPDSLVLAIITTTTAEDTRHNTDICGVIDTAGELSTQVEWAVNYINTEIDSKLQQVEADIAAQDAKLDAKIAEVQAVADSIVPPPVGSIKFSASQNVDEDWLPCDGRFVNEADYPELVEALGKLTPSADKFNLISSGEIDPQITNGVLYGGRLWVYSYSAKKLYGVDVEGTAAVKEISVTSSDPNWLRLSAPSNSVPLALSILPHPDSGAAIFLAQIPGVDGDKILVNAGSTIDIQQYVLVFSSEFTGSESSVPLSLSFTSAVPPSTTGSAYIPIQKQNVIPMIWHNVVDGAEKYYIVTGSLQEGGSASVGGFAWGQGDESASYKTYARVLGGANSAYSLTKKLGFSPKNKGELITAFKFQGKTSPIYVYSFPSGVFEHQYASLLVGADQTDPATMPIGGSDKLILRYDKSEAMRVLFSGAADTNADFSVNLPSASRHFIDAGAYLWGKDIFMMFVGTGIIFSRTLEEGDFGYLDTTSVLGTITQFGYLDYSQDENTVYLLGQDTTNTVKVAKMELNTLYDYANDGAWLPMIASDGIPSYIKATPSETPSGPTVPMSVKVENAYASSCDVYFNGEKLIAGTYSRNVSEGGKFTIGIKGSATYALGLKLNGSIAITQYNTTDMRTVEFNVSDYISSGVTLTVY